MKTKIIAAFVLAGYFATTSFAKENTEGTDDSSDLFIECAGFWYASSEVMQQVAPASLSEHLHNMGNGASTAAAWILATDRNANLPAGKQQKLGYWSDQIAPQIDAEKTRFKAVMETSGPDAVKTTLDMCTEASKVQAEIIKKLRHASR